MNYIFYDNYSLKYFDTVCVNTNKNIKYCLARDGSPLNSGPLSFDQSLFTDTELDTCDPDLPLMTQREKRNFTSSVFYIDTYSLLSFTEKFAEFYR